MDIDNIYLNKKNYYLSNDVVKQDKLFFKGCMRRVRNIIDKKDLKLLKDYAYARKTKGKWKLIKDQKKPTTQSKLLLRKRWVTNNVPAFMDDDEKKTKTEKGEKLYKYDVAPGILKLKDSEKFKDNDGNIYDIEIRGERDMNKCYFKASDIGDAFGIKEIRKSIIHKNSKYTSKQYKLMFVKKSGNSAKNDKAIFLTFDGVLQCIYGSHSKEAEGFRNWATKTLFTIKFGTKEDKKKLCDKISSYNQNDLVHLMEDYKVDKKGILNDNVYKYYELRNGTQYFNLQIHYTHRERGHRSIAHDTFDVHPKYVKYGKLLKIHRRDYQQGELIIGKNKYDIVIDRTSIKFIDEDKITIDRKNFKLFTDRLINMNVDNVECNSNFVKIIKNYDNVDIFRRYLLRG